HPDGPRARRVDAADRPAERPGQDHHLVPGPQGPGGCQMVSPWRRIWDGSTRRWRAEGKEASGVAPPKLRRDRIATRIPSIPATRLLFVNQYYWPDRASTAQHLTDLAESLAE